MRSAVDALARWAREGSDLGCPWADPGAADDTREGRDSPLSVPCMCARLSPRTSTVTPDLVSDWISRSSFASLFVSMVGAVTFGVESRGR